MHENILIGFNATIQGIAAVTIQSEETFSASMLVVQNAIRDYLIASNSFLVRFMEPIKTSEYVASPNLTFRAWSRPAVLGMRDKYSPNDSRYRINMVAIG